MDAENEKKIAFEEIEITSPALQSLVAEVDPWWQDVVTEGTRPVTVGSPFSPFVWAWDDYVRACAPNANDNPERREARNDLKDVIQSIRSSQALESYFRSRDTIMSSKRIKFEFLWTLFGHGARVYARSFMDEFQMLEVRSCSIPPIKGRRFRVSCSAFDWDGSKFSTYAYDFYIKPFADEKFINSLDVFPTTFFTEADGSGDDTQLRERLYERGLKYCNACTREPNSVQCKYQGMAIVSPSGLLSLRSSRLAQNVSLYSADPSWEEWDIPDMEVFQFDMTSKESRVVIDNWSFLNSKRNLTPCDTPPLGKKDSYPESDCVCGICKSSPLQKWRLESGAHPPPTDTGKVFAQEGERLVYLPPRLLGFALEQKVWGQFLVDKIIDTEQGDDPAQSEPFWKDLQLEESTKKLLMAFVNNHASSRLRRTGSETGSKGAETLDVIEGKGQGLAIMLHGPPGVGKTLTAETIALATGRPLLTVSVADIGVEPHAAEQKLSEVFADAARWEAVLLVDEADVFVEERIKGDLNRNAMVSVLLKCLEYYDGECTPRDHMYSASVLTLLQALSFSRRTEYCLSTLQCSLVSIWLSSTKTSPENNGLRSTRTALKRFRPAKSPIAGIWRRASRGLRHQSPRSSTKPTDDRSVTSLLAPGPWRRAETRSWR